MTEECKKCRINKCVKRRKETKKTCKLVKTKQQGKREQLSCLRSLGVEKNQRGKAKEVEDKERIGKK